MGFNPNFNETPLVLNPINYYSILGITLIAVFLIYVPFPRPLGPEARFRDPGALKNRSGTCLNAPGVFFCIEFACANRWESNFGDFL